MRAVTALVALCLLAAQLTERRVDFEADEAGAAPRFFAPAVTGDAEGSKWLVEEAQGAPSGKKVLARREGDAGEDRYALCLYETPKAADADIEVQLNPVGGKVAQSGGVVARCIDRNNYYVARADAREGNVRLYAVVQGKATLIAGQPVAVDAGKWGKLRLVAQGRNFQVFFNDVKMFEAADDAHRDPGNVGLWTSADSAILFDDLIIKPVAKK